MVFSCKKKFNFIGSLLWYLLQHSINSYLHIWRANEKQIANGNISLIHITHNTSQKQIQNKGRHDGETRTQYLAWSSSGTVYGIPKQNMFNSFGNKIPNKWNNPISECMVTFYPFDVIILLSEFSFRFQSMTTSHLRYFFHILSSSTRNKQNNFVHIFMCGSLTFIFWDDKKKKRRNMKILYERWRCKESPFVIYVHDKTVGRGVGGVMIKNK